MRDPGSVVPVPHLAQLVGADLVQRGLVLRLVVLDGDLGGHAPHGMDAAAVAGAHRELRVGPHVRLLHRDLRAIRKHRPGIVLAGLDEAEDVVPAAAVQTRGVLAQFVEDLVHLEGGGKGLDEDRRLDGARLEAKRLLAGQEHVVPDACLEMTLQLRKVEVGSGAARQELVRVVEEVEAEVEEAARNGRAIQGEVTLGKMEPPGAHDEHRGPLVQPVLFSAHGIVEGELPPHGIPEIQLPLDQVFPGRRVGVLEIRHEHVGARVERVDHHLAVGGSRDLDGAAEEVVRKGRHLPFLGADRSGPGEEVERLSLCETLQTHLALFQRFEDSGREGTSKILEEAQRLSIQDLREPRMDRSLDDQGTVLLCVPNCHTTRLTTSWRQNNNYLLNN